MILKKEGVSSRLALAAAFSGLALLLIVIAVQKPRGNQPPEDSIERVGDGYLVTQRKLIMGTVFSAKVWVPDGEQGRASDELVRMFERLEELERRISSWLPASDTSRINAAAGKDPVQVGADFRELLGRSLEWARRSGGAFDVTGGPLFELWAESRRSARLPTRDEIDACRAVTGYRLVRLEAGYASLPKPGMKLDFGAIGKGLAADRAGAHLRAKGFSNYLIDAGGDLLVNGRQGDRAWRLAVRHPRHKEYLATLEAGNFAIASSGDYENYVVIDGRRYSHIIDLRTGEPARRLTAATVIAPCAADADALATALIVMEPAQGLELVDSLDAMEALLVDADGQISTSSGLRLQNDKLMIAWD